MIEMPTASLSVNAPEGQTSADALNVPTAPLLGWAVTVSVSVNCVGAPDCALPCRASAAEAPMPAAAAAAQRSSAAVRTRPIRKKLMPRA